MININYIKTKWPDMEHTRWEEGFIRDRYYGLVSLNYYNMMRLYIKSNLAFELQINGLNFCLSREAKNIEKQAYEYILSQN